MADGFRVVTTSYTYVRDAEEAYDLAIKGRQDGKRTEIITEDAYSGLTVYLPKMQDLLEWRRKNILGLPA
jgi:hypothetical protein